MKNARFTVIGAQATKSYEVQWDFIGEGYSGDYDEKDPDDKPLWRLDLFDIQAEEQVVSWCTQLPVEDDLDEAQLHRTGIWIAERSSQVLRDPDRSIEGLWDALSHIDPTWLESRAVFTEKLDRMLALKEGA